MISAYIEGKDATGKDIAGTIVDKIRSVDFMQIPAPGGQIGRQTIPMPIDMYLVLSDTNTLHLVNPVHIARVKSLPLRRRIVKRVQL